MFKLVSPYGMSGDQPEAVETLCRALRAGEKEVTLRGVTGSGKTFALANVIAELKRPALVISHNKALAMQLYGELKAFFPHNAVEFFISYYDYYLPESYIPQTDTYIAKDSATNDHIERLRLSATASLLERKDVIVVASVSCIYGLGSPDDFTFMCLQIEPGMALKRNDLIRHLIQGQYNRNDADPQKGEFRVRGDCVELFQMQRDGFLKIEFFGDTVERISRCDEVTRKRIETLNCAVIFPCKQFVMPQDRIDAVVPLIQHDLQAQIAFFQERNLLIEAQRIEQRTLHDLDMMKEIGYCSGIENYSAYLSNRKPGERPYCLLDFFPKDFLTIIDESHVSIPQIGAMYRADQSRKTVLVDHGFRLPMALENRPLRFEEFDRMTPQKLFISATPGPYETEHAKTVADLVVRPTGLLDPEIIIRPLEGQIDDVIAEVRAMAARGMRTLITTLTKKSAERLSEYLNDLKLRVNYMHSEIDVLERSRILNELRRGEFDCLIGINLLREGLDLPEVGLVCILDADKEGFLRSERALVQTAGRAARNVEGRVILYADKMTDAIIRLTEITRTRRRKQAAYNAEHGIVPKTVKSEIKTNLGDILGRDPIVRKGGKNKSPTMTLEECLASGGTEGILTQLEAEMNEAAAALEFERAALLRDQIRQIETLLNPDVKAERKSKRKG